MGEKLLRGHEELYYERLLGDVHRSLVGKLYDAGGVGLNVHTEDRIRYLYGDETETDPVRDVKLALVYGQEAVDQTEIDPLGAQRRHSDAALEDMNPLDDAYVSEEEEDFYDAATDGGDLDAFLAIADGDLKPWYHDTVEALHWMGYDSPTAENMLVDLANEAHTPREPYERKPETVAERAKSLLVFSCKVVL